MILRTPIVCGSRLFEKGNVYFKLENLQQGGSFKMRGIVEQFMNRSPTYAVTMSAGNYGKSFAMKAKALGIPCTVCMPDTVPQDRYDLISSLSAKIIKSPSSTLLEAVHREVSRTSGEFFHPFDDNDLFKGYRSISTEILQDMPNLCEQDTVIVPCGGGGLLAGIALGFHQHNCPVRIIGIEPEAAPGQYTSRIAKKAQTSFPLSATIASGLAPPVVGSLCFEHIENYVHDLCLVSDAAIRSAIRYNSIFISQHQFAYILQLAHFIRLVSLSNPAELPALLTCYPIQVNLPLAE